MFGGFHVLWSLLILLGWAQPLMSFSLWAHMVNATPNVGSFDAAAAATVIVIAAIVGYCVGYILSTVWNKVHRA
jgi:hypothetical protein